MTGLTQFEQDILDKAKQLKEKPKILFPETKDLRVLQAIERIALENIAIPVVMESPQLIQMRYPHLREEYLVEIKPNITGDKSDSYLYVKQAANLLVEKKVDGVIVGAITPSAQVLRTALKYIGKALGCDTISASMFIISKKQLNEKEEVYLFADVAVTVEPTERQLVDMALSSAETWKKITGTPPRVGMLSFSTLGSATHSSIFSIQNAVKEVKRLYPEIMIFGETQFDAAINPEIALTKGIPYSGGKANVLIFPNLAAANIGYKIAEQLGHAKTIAVIQGLRQPFFDISRGCSVDEIVLTSAMLSIYAHQTDKEVESL